MEWRNPKGRIFPCGGSVKERMREPNGIEAKGGPLREEESVLQILVSCALSSPQGETAFVLLAVEGLENREIAQRLGHDRGKVGRWRSRKTELGLTGIEKDKTWPWRIRPISEAKRLEYSNRKHHQSMHEAEPASGMAFLSQTVGPKYTEGHKDVHVICDNYSTTSTQR